MLTAAIFFKGLQAAKSRLRSVLSPRERADLAQQMLIRVVDAARGASGVGEILIVTSEPDIETIVGRREVRILHKARPRGFNAAVLFAVARLAAEGKKSVLILPADLPLIGPTHIDRLIEKHGRTGTDTIVPSSDGTGTNALIMELPPHFPLAFGPDSFNRHLASAARRGQALAIHRCEFIGVDIDQPEDLQHLPCGIMA